MRSVSHLNILPLGFTSACKANRAHAPASRGPLTPQPNGVPPASLCTWSQRIIQVGSTCGSPLGFPYILPSMSGAIYSHTVLSKAVGTHIPFCLTESFRAVTSLQLNSACQGSSTMKSLTGKQTGLQNSWQARICPKSVCCCTEHVPLYRVTKTPSHCPQTGGSPPPARRTTVKSIFCYVKIGFDLETRTREAACPVFISVRVVAGRRINCHHAAGEEDNRRGFFWQRERSDFLVLLLGDLSQDQYSYVRGKKKNPPK